MHHPAPERSSRHHDVVVIGGGAAGIAVTASLLKRRGDLDIAIVDPAETHSYQPGWTLVGGGVFSSAITRRPMADVIPDRASWYAVDAERVDPEAGEVVLGDGRRLAEIEVNFYNAGEALFGVADYVPALEGYIARYGIEKAFGYRLVAVDGPSSTAQFVVSGEAGERTVERPFDMLHAVPPQKAPALIAGSGLANAGGWLDLDPETLQHVHYPAVFGLGDASGTANAKTAAAVRKQAPVVAENLLATLDETPLPAAYLGYGSCPLTVERGRIVLSEFGYGGTPQPTFPRWVNEGTRATRRAWWLKAKQLPWLYWNGMLKGHEWLARPACRD